MTGKPGHNFQAFNAAAVRLEKLGFEVANPADKGIVEGWSWADYLRYDLKILVDCDAIFLLDGWEESEGANLEYHVAQRLGLLEIR